MNKILVGDILSSKFSFLNNQSNVITIGKFSILHKGHEHLLSKTIQACKIHKATPIVFSFFPSPTFTFTKEKPIFATRSRFDIIKSFFQENNVSEFLLFLQKFNKNFLSLPPDGFLEKLYSTFNVKAVVVGEDFKFGKNGLGDLSLLQQFNNKHNIETIIVEQLKDDSDVISSKKLIQCLKDGNINKFNEFVFGGYFIEGVVIKGRQIAGSVLGFKTANVKLKSFLQHIKYGVYACKVKLDSIEHFGILNIGIKPTINGNEPLCEVHMFNFDKNIYGKKLFIFPKQLLREEQKFASLEDLKKQINIDISIAKKCLYKESLTSDIS